MLPTRVNFIVLPTRVKMATPNEKCLLRRERDFDATASFNLLFEDRVETYKLTSDRLNHVYTDWLTECKSRCKWLINSYHHWGLSAYQLQGLSVPILAYGHGVTELDCVSLTYGRSLHLMLSHLQTTGSCKHNWALSTPDAQLQSVPCTHSASCTALLHASHHALSLAQARP